MVRREDVRNLVDEFGWIVNINRQHENHDTHVEFEVWFA